MGHHVTFQLTPDAIAVEEVYEVLIQITCECNLYLKTSRIALVVWNSGLMAKVVLI